MRRFVAILCLALSLSACSSGKDRLEAIGADVSEVLQNYKTDSGFQMIQSRIIDVPPDVDLEALFSVLPSVDHVQLLRFRGHNIGCREIGEIAKHQEVYSLVFDECDLDTTCLNDLARLPKLNTIAITRTAITSKDAQFLKEIPTLANVTLNNTNVDDDLATTLLQMPRLRRVFVSETGITNQFVSTIAELRLLEWLRVDQTKVTSEGLLPLAKAPILTRVHALHLPYSPVIEMLAESCQTLRAVALDVSEAEAMMYSTPSLTVLPPSRADASLDD